MHVFFRLFILLVIPFLLLSCDILDVSGLDDDDRQVKLVVKASYSISPDAPSTDLTGLNNDCPSPAPTEDIPGYASGNDCDDDGGVVRYMTPSDVSIAFKSIQLFKNGVTINLQDEAATLADSTVYNLSETDDEVVVTFNTFAEGTYQVRAEIYYVDYTFNMNIPTQDMTVRVYMSDDNFPAEGNRGHHQGDLTLIDDDIEAGFIPENDTWTVTDATSTRGSIVGPGGTDSQTGHARGFYGDADFWNTAILNQGNDEDIFIVESSSTVSVGNFARKVTITLPVNNMWFYEDFDNNQVFNPCEGESGAIDEACTETAEWTPIVPFPSVSITEL